MSDVEGSYSEIADRQLDEFEAMDIDLYNDILESCQSIFESPGKAQSRSAAIQTAEGIRLRLPVDNRPAYKVFWSSDGPRIEAVFRYP